MVYEGHIFCRHIHGNGMLGKSCIFLFLADLANGQLGLCNRTALSSALALSSFVYSIPGHRVHAFELRYGIYNGIPPH